MHAFLVEGPSLRILIDFSQIPVKRTGAGVYAENLVRELRPLLGLQDHLYLLVQSDEAMLRQLIPADRSVQFLSIPSAIFRNRLALLLFEQIILPWIVLIHRIDLLHSLHYTMPLWAPAVRVVTFHDLTMILHPQLHTRGRRLLMPVFMRIAWKLADAIISVSAATQKDAERIFPASSKLRGITPLGVSMDAFARLPEAEIDECLAPLNVKQPYFLFLGTIEPRKNVPALIHAFETFAVRHPKYNLVLAGKWGWNCEPAISALSSSPVRERILDLGYVSVQTRRALLVSCEALIYPSSYEGFGLPVLEGMAAGVPVITSNVSSLPEVAGDAAILVSPSSVADLASAMESLVIDPKLGDEYRQRGQSRARKFSWRRTAERTYDIYRAALKPK